MNKNVCSKLIQDACSFSNRFVIYMYTVCLQYFCRFSIEISDPERDNESDESETSASPCRYIAYCSLHTRI